MTDKPKFKQTEVGMIPSDWEETYLGNIGPVKMCKRVMKSQTSEKGDIPFYKIGTFGKSPDAYISKDLYHYLKNKYSFPQKGTVLISAAGTIGRTVVYDGKDAFFQDSNIVWLENDESVLTNQYLYYLYQVVEWKTENGGAVSRLYNDNFKITPIAIPSSKKEQQRIANALSDVDTLIANLEKLIAKKKNIIQGAMQQLLTGRKRLPGFSKPWIDKKLGEGLKFQCGAPFQSTYFNREHQGVRLIKNRDLKSDDQIYYYDGEYTYDYIVKNGNLLVGMDGDFMPCLWNKGTALLNQRVGRILTNCWSLPYLYYILIKPLLEKQDGTGATTVKHLSHRDVENMVVYMTTDIQEQTAIANVLSDMDTEISALETKLAKYRTLKTGMMQQLLTGKIRLIK